MELEEHRMGEMLLWAPKNHDKPRSLDAVEKIANEKLDKLLTEKSELRDETCWCNGCPKSAAFWVREVQFDMKNDKAVAGNFRQVTSADYNSPVPGFCIGHIGSGPPELAQAVYFNRAEMNWGLKPKRWFVIFTDGTKQGGECVAIDPLQRQPEFVEEFTTKEPIVA